MAELQESRSQQGRRDPFFGPEDVGAGEEIDPEAYRIVDEYVREHPGGQEQLIPLLHKVQEHLGYLPFPIQEYVAEQLGMSPVEVYGVVSFYHFFSTEKKGRFRVKVCMGTACFVKRAQHVLEKFSEELSIGVNEVSEDGLFSLEEVRCVGACGLAPVVVINDEVYGGVDPKRVRKIIRKQKQRAKAERPVEEASAGDEGDTQ